MAQPPPPEGTTPAPVQAPDRVPPRTPELPSGFVFKPTARNLLDDFLIPRALRGVVKDPYKGISEGVDVYAVRPEALPFMRQNKGLHGHVWGYFFVTRPAAGGGIGDEGGDDVRDVAAGGSWRRYGEDKEYVGRDKEVYGYHRCFAFHEAGPRCKKTVWRMREFRLKETAPTFRGAVFRPDAKGLVICKVYNEVIPKEEPAVDYYGNRTNEEDEEEEKIGSIVITVGDAAAAPDA